MARRAGEWEAQNPWESSKQKMEGAKFATTIANPLGARQESAPVESIVTAVRMFSESLLTNRVSKEVQQEVKALAAHMEMLVTRRRLAANRSRSPSAAETRLALRNLKRFLEREAHKDRAKKKANISCATDSLESSGEHVQVLSPGTGRTQTLRTGSMFAPDAGAEQPPTRGVTGCGSRGDTNCCRQPEDSNAELAAEELRLRFSVQSFDPQRPLPKQPQQQEHRRQRKPRLKEYKPVPTPPTPLLSPKEPGAEEARPLLPTPPPPPLLPELLQQAQESQRPQSPPLTPTRPHGLKPWNSARQVSLTCSEPLPLLMLPSPPSGAAPSSAACADGAGNRVHVLTGCTLPMPPAEHEKLETPTAPVEVVTGPGPGCCFGDGFLRLRSPARVQRAPTVVANHQLEAGHVRVEMAVERVHELTVLAAESILCRAERRDLPSISGGEFGRAPVAEQGNFNCASLSAHIAIVSWANATLAEVVLCDADSLEQLKGSQPLVSTCSCPSDTEGGRNKPTSRATGAEADEVESDGKKRTEDSVDIQTSSALLQQVESGRLGHESIQPVTVRLEQRVCESCSPEVMVSSTSYLTVGGGPFEWQQPLFRIMDLYRLVRLAAPLARSISPTEAMEVAVDSSRRRATEVSSNAAGDADKAETVGSGGISGRSRSTLEVVDQSATTLVGETGAAEPAAGSVSAPQIVAAEAASAASREALVFGCTWSSCEVGQSSGFTKLLLTLDKAKRRREQHGCGARRQQQQRPVAVGGSSRSGGNNSGSHRPRSANRRLPLQQPLTPAEVIAQRQEEALRLAAKSLTALARSLQMCVRRVHEAADAINCTL